MTPIIEINHLSKKYHKGEKNNQTHSTFRDSLTSHRKKITTFLKSPSRFLTTQKKNSTRLQVGEFWALHNLNLTINPGEKVAIIGANGAGKSTLLKLMSRITAPTTGRITLLGQVASLLEVGAGFNGELTGRENIFLNGTILGMTNQEIKSKFKEIVDFAEVADFIDTPYKHYSSGMSMRLAFAVAAFLEPEILLIDEVLAVGDLAFQKKSLQKMQEVSQKDGKTIVFVSHDLGAISNLCDRGIFIDHGQVKYDGPIENAINYYLESRMQKLAATGSQHLVNLTQHPHKKDPEIGIKGVEILVNGQPSHFFQAGDDLNLRFYFDNPRPLQEPNLGLVIKNPRNQAVLAFSNRITGNDLKSGRKSGWIEVFLPKFSLYGEGQFFIDLYYGNKNDDFDTIHDAFYLEVRKNNFYHSGHFLKPNLNAFAPEIIFN